MALTRLSLKIAQTVLAVGVIGGVSSPDADAADELGARRYRGSVGSERALRFSSTPAAKNGPRQRDRGIRRPRQMPIAGSRTASIRAASVGRAYTTTAPAGCVCDPWMWPGVVRTATMYRLYPTGPPHLSAQFQRYPGKTTTYDVFTAAGGVGREAPLNTRGRRSAVQVLDHDSHLCSVLCLAGDGVETGRVFAAKAGGAAQLDQRMRAMWVI